MLSNWRMPLIAFVACLVTLAQIGKAQDVRLAGKFANGYIDVVSNNNHYVPSHIEFVNSHQLAIAQPRALTGRVLGLHLTDPGGCEPKKILFVTYYDCQGKDQKDKVRCFLQSQLPKVLVAVLKVLKKSKIFTNVAGYKGKLMKKAIEIVVKLMKDKLIPLLADLIADQLVTRLQTLKETPIVGQAVYQVVNTFFYAFPGSTKGGCNAPIYKASRKQDNNLQRILNFTLPIVIDLAFTTIPPIAPAGLVLSALPIYPMILEFVTSKVAYLLAKVLLVFLKDEWFAYAAYLIDSNETGAEDSPDDESILDYLFDSKYNPLSIIRKHITSGLGKLLS